MRILLLVLLPLLLNAVNPGVVVGLPLPSNIPNQYVPLPYQLENFTVKTAEFTNV